MRNPFISLKYLQIKTVDENSLIAQCGFGLFPLASPHATAVGKEGDSDQWPHIIVSHVKGNK